MVSVIILTSPHNAYKRSAIFCLFEHEDSRVWSAHGGLAGVSSANLGRFSFRMDNLTCDSAGVLPFRSIRISLIGAHGTKIWLPPTWASKWMFRQLVSEESDTTCVCSFPKYQFSGELSDPESSIWGCTRTFLLFQFWVNCRAADIQGSFNTCCIIASLFLNGFTRLVKGPSLTWLQSRLWSPMPLRTKYFLGSYFWQTVQDFEPLNRIAPYASAHNWETQTKPSQIAQLAGRGLWQYSFLLREPKCHVQLRCPWLLLILVTGEHVTSPDHHQGG